jgi:hypothetical protein
MPLFPRDAVVFGPPSPHLGNFNHLFDVFLKRASNTEACIDVAELNARLDAIGTLDLDVANKRPHKPCGLGIDGTFEAVNTTNVHAGEALKARTVLSKPTSGTPRNSSPRRSKTAKASQSSAIQDTVDDDATPTGLSTFNTGHGAVHSSPETTDTTLHRESVFDRTPWQDASEVTPLTSPDAIMYAEIEQPTPTRKGSYFTQGNDSYGGYSKLATTTYNYSAVGLSGFQAVRYNATSASIQGNIVHSSNVSMSSTQGVFLSGNGSVYSGLPAPGIPTGMSLSSNGLFRYHLSSSQPYPGAELYSVEAAMSGVDRITPHYMCTRDDKLRVLAHKLQKVVNMDRLTEATVPAATSNVHVFVDLSNITIGFYDCLKASHNIPITRRMKAPRFSFDHLACVLERGRNVEKRVVAGSLDSTYARKWPGFMQEAKELDYEMCIMQRVAKAVMPTGKNKRVSTLEPEWTASDANSSSEETFVGQLRQGEQGVDEVLHLKMLQSVVDDKPGTAVLATGDAAEAEFSDGFKKNVERLLNNGWNVEIIGWSKGISKAWRDPEFVAQYGDRVRVIELDPFVEEIFGAWFDAPGY